MRESNLYTRSSFHQSAASQFDGAARGFASVALRLRFRSSLMSYLRLSPTPSPPARRLAEPATASDRGGVVASPDSAAASPDAAAGAIPRGGTGADDTAASPDVTADTSDTADSTDSGGGYASGLSIVTLLQRTGSASHQRAHVDSAALALVRQRLRREGFELRLAAISADTPLAAQVAAIARSRVLVSAHGAGLVHIPLLPPTAAVLELFSCGHFSYLYQHLATASGLGYFALHPPGAGCATPASMTDSLRQNLSQPYAYAAEELLPTLLQAVRYAVWASAGEVRAPFEVGAPADDEGEEGDGDGDGTRQHPQQ